MRAIPIVRCSNVRNWLVYYTQLLGFEKKYPDARDTDWVIDLVQDGAEIQLSQHSGDGAFGSAIHIRVTDVDSLFQKQQIPTLGLVS